MNHIKILLNGKFFALKTIRDVTSYSEIDGCIKFFRELRAEEMALFQPHTLGKKVVTAYRYVETDAVVDGFTDADFGGNLTGTNLQGYILGGNLALSSRVWTTLRWMSSDSIAGPTYKNDLIQFDINAKF